jgi:hypothetical protein
MDGRRKKEVRQRIRSTDVTDVTDVADVRKKEEGKRKKEKGKRKKEKGRIIPQTRNAQCFFSAQLSIPNDQLSISKTNRGCLAPPTN